MPNAVRGEQDARESTQAAGTAPGHPREQPTARQRTPEDGPPPPLRDDELSRATGWTVPAHEGGHAVLGDGDGTAAALRSMAGLDTSVAVRVAATLRIADHIVAGRHTVRELADAVGAHADALERLLRNLAVRGVLDRDDASGRYTPTAPGQPLRDTTRRESGPGSTSRAEAAASCRSSGCCTACAPARPWAGGLCRAAAPSAHESKGVRPESGGRASEPGLQVNAVAFGREAARQGG